MGRGLGLPEWLGGWNTGLWKGAGTQGAQEGQAAREGYSLCRLSQPINLTSCPLHAPESLNLDMLGLHGDLPCGCLAGSVRRACDPRSRGLEFWPHTGRRVYLPFGWVRAGVKDLPLGDPPKEF